MHTRTSRQHLALHVLQFFQLVCTFLSVIFVFTDWSVLFVE